MQAQTTSERPSRKYALTRIAAGDYLLPSNDGQTIWRIAKYVDGPSMGLEDWPRDRELWGYWKWTGRVTRDGAVDVEDWAKWEQIGAWCETRQEAIDGALREATRGA